MKNTLFLLLIIFISACSDDTTSPIGVKEDKTEIKEFKSVTICDRIWMSENLDVDRYKNGDTIRYAKTLQEWRDANNKKEGAYCYYNNDTNNRTKYGKLYNWYAVSDPRGLAPLGWHIPTYEEWENLIECLGGALIAGGKLKSTGDWASPNIGATNSSGFSALPSGILDYDINKRENYFTTGYTYISTFWWSSNSYIDNYNIKQHLLYTLSNAYPEAIGRRKYSFDNISDFNLGIPVRCIKDYISNTKDSFIFNPFDIMPLKVGNYYIFDNYQLDSLSGQKIISSVKEDSIVIEEEMDVLNNKTGFILSIYNSKIKKEINFIYKENNSVQKIFTKNLVNLFKNREDGNSNYNVFINELSKQLNNIVNDKWLKIYDDVDKWLILDTNIENISLFDNKNIHSLHINLVANKTSYPISNDIQIENDKYVKIYPYKYPYNSIMIKNSDIKKVEISMNLKYKDSNGYENAVTLKKYIWFSNKIGIIKEELPPLDLFISNRRIKANGCLRSLKGLNI